MRQLLGVWTVMTLAVAYTCAQNLDDLPQYKPDEKIAECETIRSWGSGDMASLMKPWEAGFRKYQPGVRFSDTQFIERWVHAVPSWKFGIT